MSKKISTKWVISEVPDNSHQAYFKATLMIGNTLTSQKLFSTDLILLREIFSQWMGLERRAKSEDCPSDVLEYWGCYD